MKTIAHIRTDFSTKFGIPRQSGLVEELEGRVVFTPPYRREEALRGIEGFSHLWLIWRFSQAERENWSPTVRPPRLGGNVRMGVFATRSPFRPNPIGLSCVRLLGVEELPELGPTLRVAGADLMDATPILDIKPYVPYADCRRDAVGGFATEPPGRLRVEAAEGLLDRLPPEKWGALVGALSCDPRPAYREEGERVYGMGFAGYEVRFRVEGGVLTVTEIREEEKG